MQFSALWDSLPYSSPRTPDCSGAPLGGERFRGARFNSFKIIFHSHANKTRFHKKGCAPSLILKVRVFGTRKWPIILVLCWGGAFAHFFKPQTVRFLFECQVLT